MKKFILCLLAVVTIVSGIMAGITPAGAADLDLKIGSNMVGSTWYVMAACIADVVKKTYPEIQIDASPIAGGIGNLKLFAEGKMNIALTMDNNNLWAYKGEVLFDKPITNFRTLVGGMDQFYVGIAIRRNSGFNSLEDIVKNKSKLIIS